MDKACYDGIGLGAQILDTIPDSIVHKDGRIYVIT